MTSGRFPPVWGEPSTANEAPAPLRQTAMAGNAAYRAEGGTSGAIAVVGASVSGPSHRLARRRCEDCFGWAEPVPGRLGLVVADGVGSAGRGGEGAELAVKAACQAIVESPGGTGGADCLGAIRAASEQMMSVCANAPAVAELATTIVVAVFDLASASVSLARVGDSTAFLLDENGVWTELFSEPGTERGLTAALPVGPGSAFIEATSATLAEGTGLVLLTDGVADPLRDGPSTVAPALADVLVGASTGVLSPLDLAQAAAFSRRGAHDDRTILLAWRREDPSSA